MMFLGRPVSKCKLAGTCKPGSELADGVEVRSGNDGCQRWCYVFHGSNKGWRVSIPPPFHSFLPGQVENPALAEPQPHWSWSPDCFRRFFGCSVAKDETPQLPEASIKNVSDWKLCLAYGTCNHLRVVTRCWNVIKHGGMVPKSPEMSQKPHT